MTNTAAFSATPIKPLSKPTGRNEHLPKLDTTERPESRLSLTASNSENNENIEEPDENAMQDYDGIGKLSEDEQAVDLKAFSNELYAEINKRLSSQSHLLSGKSAEKEIPSLLPDHEIWDLISDHEVSEGKRLTFQANVEHHKRALLEKFPLDEFPTSNLSDEQVKALGEVLNKLTYEAEKFASCYYLDDDVDQSLTQLGACLLLILDGLSKLKIEQIYDLGLDDENLLKTITRQILHDELNQVVEYRQEHAAQLLNLMLASLSNKSEIVQLKLIIFTLLPALTLCAKSSNSSASIPKWDRQLAISIQNAGKFIASDFDEIQKAYSEESTEYTYELLNRMKELASIITAYIKSSLSESFPNNTHIFSDTHAQIIRLTNKLFSTIAASSPSNFTNQQEAKDIAETFITFQLSLATLHFMSGEFTQGVENTRLAGFALSVANSVFSTKSPINENLLENIGHLAIKQGKGNEEQLAGLLLLIASQPNLHNEPVENILASLAKSDIPTKDVLTQIFIITSHESMIRDVKKSLGRHNARTPGILSSPESTNRTRINHLETIKELQTKAYAAAKELVNLTGKNTGKEFFSLRNLIKTEITILKLKSKDSQQEHILPNFMKPLGDVFRALNPKRSELLEKASIVLKHKELMRLASNYINKDRDQFTNDERDQFSNKFRNIESLNQLEKFYDNPLVQKVLDTIESGLNDLD